MINEDLEQMAYDRGEPDINALNAIYESDLTDHSGFAEVCADSYNQKWMWWPGKTRDQKKYGARAKGLWNGASDQEVPIILPRCQTLIALMMNAVRSGQIEAAPVEGNDLEQSSNVGVFIRWMMDSWIKGGHKQLERGMNDMLDFGYGCMWVGWEKYKRTHLEEIDITDEERLAADPSYVEFVELVLDEDREDELIEQLRQTYEAVDEKGARKALKELREVGVAKIPVVKGDVNRPVFEAKNPSYEIIFPAHTKDPRDAERVHIRHFMSIQDLRSAIEFEGYDKDMVGEIIENHMGMTANELSSINEISSGFSPNSNTSTINWGDRDAEDLVEIVRTMQRLVDDETGAIGYYQTIWCPKLAQSDEDYYLVHELLNGWDEFNLAVTTLTEEAQVLQDTPNVSMLLRGTQREAKIMRDSNNDQISLTLSPPRTYPMGRDPSAWGPSVQFGVRPSEQDSFRSLEVPNTQRTGIDREKFLAEEADFILGLDFDSPLALQRQQYFINRGLLFVAECMRLAYKGYQKFYNGPDIHFRVTGNPDPQSFNGSPIDEDMDIKIFYDVRNQDTEYVKSISEAVGNMSRNSMTGTIDPVEADKIQVHLIAPQFAGRLLRSADQTRNQIISKVANDLALIASGQGADAQPNGAQVALEYLQQYVSQPDIQMKMSNDPEWAQRFQTYADQYQFQITQTQNAEIGKRGTEQTLLNGANTIER